MALGGRNLSGLYQSLKADFDMKQSQYAELTLPCEFNFINLNCADLTERQMLWRVPDISFWEVQLCANVVLETS